MACGPMRASAPATPLAVPATSSAPTTTSAPALACRPDRAFPPATGSPRGPGRPPQPPRREASAAGAAGPPQPVEIWIRALPERGAPARRLTSTSPKGDLCWRWCAQRTAGFRGLAAMVALGIILSLLPRERLQEVGTRLFELIGPAGQRDRRGRPAAGAAGAPRRAARCGRARPVGCRRGRTLTRAGCQGRKPALRPRRRSPPRRSRRKRPSSCPSTHRGKRGRKRPCREASPKLAVASKADAEPVAPPSAPAPATEERFVPVVFTHKDHATVLRALSELKTQYPNLLIGLEGEIQPLDLGKKGIWHRLVFLPPGPRRKRRRSATSWRPRATTVWVKASRRRAWPV